MAATPEIKPQNEQVEQQPSITPLAEVIDEVRKDAQRDPKGYQRETIVPEGGE